MTRASVIYHETNLVMQMMHYLFCYFVEQIMVVK